MEHIKKKLPFSVWILWCLVLWISALLRLSYPDWDQGIAAHPDERFLLGVAHDMSLYANPCEISPAFPYGHFPLNLISFIVNLASDVDPLYSGRLLSGLVGVLLVALAGRCGTKLSGSRCAGLLAALLAAFCPFLIQQSHFYTVDPWVAVFGTLALLLAMGQQWFWGGVAVGLAVACKASGAWIGVCIGLAMATTTSRSVLVRHGLHYAIGISVGLLGGAPWLLLAPVQCGRGPLVQAQLAAGRIIFPYTRQYAHTLPWAYPFFQMVLWGMGPTISISGAVTLLKGRVALKRGRRDHAIAFLSTVLFFVVTAGLYVKYPRYLLPIYPIWIGFAAKGMHLFFQGYHQCKSWWWPSSVVLVIVLLTCALGVAQASVYRGVHPWVEASRWIYNNVFDGATIVVESWDHPLPVPLVDGDPERYQQVVMPVLDGDWFSSLDDEVPDDFRETEVVVLASRRNYGVVARQPQRYEGLYAWYEALFEEREALVFSRCPMIGPIALSDYPFQGFFAGQSPTVREICDADYVIRLPRLDESFRVYDAPVTVVLVGGH